MKHKRILLIEENYDDILQVQNSLKSLNGEHTLHVVHNIRDALQVLMGGSSPGTLENYTQTGKVRPDIVLLNIGFLQESAREFLDVINKYYSLKNIRVFIIGDSEQSVDPELAARYGIAGYLVKPLDLQNTVNESVVTFRRELISPGKALFALPAFFSPQKIISLFQIVKTNAASVFAGQTIIAKVAVSSVATVCVVGAITVTTVSEAASSRSGEQKTAATLSGNDVEVVKMDSGQPEEAAVTENAVTDNHPHQQESAPVKKIPAKRNPTKDPAAAEKQEERTYRIVAIEEPEPIPAEVN